MNLYKYDLFQIEDQVFQRLVWTNHLVKLFTHFRLVGAWINPMLVEELVIKFEDFVAKSIANLLFPYLCRVDFLGSSACLFLFLFLLLTRLFLWWSEDVFFEVVLESGHNTLHQSRIFFLNHLFFAEIVDNLKRVGAFRNYWLIVVSIGLIILQVWRLKLVDLALSWVTEVHGSHALSQIAHHKGVVLVLSFHHLLRSLILLWLTWNTKLRTLWSEVTRLQLGRHHGLRILVSAWIDLFQFFLIGNLEVLFRLGSSLFH